MTRIKLIFFFIIFQSCGFDTGHSYDEYESVFKKTKFDIAVIDKINLYDSLQELVFKNLDSLLPKENEIVSIYNVDYLSNLDNTLKNDFQKLFTKIGKDNIESFSLTRDTVLSIKIRSTYSKEINSKTEHMLEFKKDKKKEPNSYPFERDTIIDKKWTYTIWTDAKNDI